ncbi:Amino acid adenylation [Xenorhabdus stockiae]|uniref:Amino acid adenylation n=1 Tax=Xenorhabdus stockiae TaxID=351614 RepID=A0A2D0KQP4_9GAMM|nr:non-ribosomal peptide synthetase [Xenorhabdus stockiae]PHM65752.1 Amino acid adenylation [Xenorhabdus stockiae]
MNNNELISLPLAERKRLLELAKAAKLSRQYTQKTEILPQPRKGDIPLSWTQQRLWFLTQLDSSAQTAYHMPVGLHLQGQLNQSALQAALDRIVARHEILRTTFISTNGTARQVIGHPDSGFALTSEDLRHLPEPEQQTAVEKRAHDEAVRPFDFNCGPLLRGHLLHLAEDEYVLLLTQHHIISDGWSVRLLIQELSTLYQAFSQEQPDPLPELSLQYADYVLWQQQWLQGERLETQLNYWREQLQDAPELLELPTDKPRPIQQSYKGNRVELAFPAELSAGLKNLSQRHGTTLFMTLMAGWAVLLSRFSGQDDLVIGTPIVNRQQPELESLIGFFANTLALRIQLSDNLSVSDLLTQVKKRALGAYAHQDLPFEQLVEALRPTRSLSHSPIFQVMLTLDNQSEQKQFELAGLKLSELPLVRESAYFDLTLTLYDTENGLVGDLEYARDLFEHATIERMVDHLQTLLAAMVADETQQVADLALLTPQQRTQLLTEFSTTEVTYPQDLLLQQLFEQQVLRSPESVALVNDGQQLSYTELNRRANQLAHALIAAGVKPDDRVAICVDRSPDMIIGLFGILKAGAGYVPLDPDYPTERLTYILSDCAPQLLLTQQHLTARLTTDIPVWVMDETDYLNTMAQQPAHNPDAHSLGLLPHHLAYIIYTSGSTGQPKGVMIEHRQVVNFVHVQRETNELTPSDRVLQFTSVSFDTTVSDIFATLATGATLVLRPAHLRIPDKAFGQFLRDQAITVSDLPTAFWHLWVQEMAAGRCGFSPSLRLVIVGGEKAELRHFNTWQSLPETQACRWINSYGPTETTVIATVWKPENRALCLNQNVPIGYPLTNTRLYILDTQGQPVPIGVAGEIHIGGLSVARGYLNRPDLTAERFISDPFSPQSNARMYKTGDLGRWLPDGTIEYLERNDFQVKIRGFRIELGEIEARLAQCDGVKDAVVVAREEENGNKRLVAYVIPQPGITLDIIQLREQLSSRLMEYMLPGAYVILDAFPVNPNGKLDRKALPAPDSSAIVQREYAEPQGEMEQTLADIWQTLLGLDQVGRHDNFFELGGHSLLTVQVAARLREKLNIEVTLQDLFTYPTLADLAQSLGNATQSTQSVILPVDRQQPLPLSWAQQRLWFLAQLDSAAQAAYHIAGGLELRGPLDQVALQAALDRIVARHEILRTTIAVIDGETRQIIGNPDSGFSLISQDLSLLSPTEQQTALKAAEQAEAEQPFDFTQGPLVRAQLLKISDEYHILLVTQHHIVSDGWSLNVLIKEFSTLYQAFCQQQPDPLPRLPIQYADYAVWQQQWLQGDKLAQQVNYWCQTLQDAPVLLELPTDYPRPLEQSYRGDLVVFTLPRELNAGLLALSQKHGTTLFMTLLAGWAILLSRLSGQQDIVIGTPVANRQYRELEPLIGFFVNTLALRVRLEDNPTVSTLLAQVKAHALAAYAHQDLPFEQLVEALQPPRSLSHSPVFQVMMGLDNTSGSSGFNLPDLTINHLPLDRKTTQFDVSLSFNESENGLVGELEYASDLFEHATIERMAEHLQTLLAAMVADETQQVADLALLTPQQRTQLLTEFSTTEVAYPQDLLLQQLFEQQVLRSPESVALVSDGQQLSYTELNRRANQLAHALIAAGVKPDDRVAICVDRSPDMIIGLFGILKAGAGYVPLDPDYPTERLAYILSDCAPQLLLTQQHLTNRLTTDIPVWVMDDMSYLNTAAQQPAHNPDAHSLGLLPHHLAYIIYTSGSTGQPKGVMIEHRQVVNFVHVQCAANELTPADRVLQFTSVCFDTTVADIFATLATGATLILRPAHLRIPDKAFSQFLRDQAITVSDLPTAFWHLWVQEMAAGRCGFSPSLRLVLVGGEKAELRHFNTWQSLPETQACRWINSYGPTETTVNATMWKSDNHEFCLTNAVPIGYPLTNTRLYILDTQGQPVPIGVAGEIHIGGLSVARGYLNRPDLTAERFITDPFSPQSNARMYKTGDLGRWLPDGTIEYLERNDFQVKIRGFRIELGEIEARLAQCDGVKDAVVVAREEENGNKRLVAYLVPQPGVTLDLLQLREQLSSRLVEYMLPGAYVILEAFPVNPNGKLDRKALPAPDSSAIVQREYAEPQGEMEQTLADIWQSLLGVEHIGRHDHFFELGGHSLLTVQVAARLREKLNIEVTLQDLFNHPTLADLAQSLGNATQSAQSVILPADRQQPLPLSWAQQRLWFLAQLDSAAQAAYHIDGGLELRGQLNQAALQAALDRIVARHEILRTTIAVIDGEASQVIGNPSSGFSLILQDLSPLSPAEQQIALKAAVQAEADQPFDFTQGPLVRAQLLKISDEHHILLVTQHHIVSDGWSLNVLIKEFSALYHAFCQQQPDPLPRLTIQYADYAVWQRQWLQGDKLAQQVNYWCQTLQNAPVLLELPTDHPRPLEQSYRGDQVIFTLPRELNAGLLALSQRNGTTLFMTLLAGWAILLSRLSGQQDIVIGTPVANRQYRELEPLIGFFVNTLALRVRLEDNPTVSTLLAQVKAHALAAYAHQDLPFEQLVEALQPPRSLSHSPVFQVMMALDNTSGSSEFNLPDLTINELLLTKKTTQFDVSLSFSESENGLVGELEYASDLFEHTTIERMAEHLQTLLAAIVADETQQVADLALLTPQQRTQLLTEFSTTEVAYPQDLLLQQLFEQQVIRSPESVALVSDGQQLSYTELNRRANQLAHALIAAGVKPDDRVAICVDRSPDMIIGLFGILKAGAGYVPLDPDYPTERLAYILSDCAPQLLLTQQHLADRLTTDIPVWMMDDTDYLNTAAQQPVHNPDAHSLGLLPHHLAYIIYTSGSTGQPKGVMIEHRQVVNFVHVQRETNELTPADRVLQFTSVSFDTTVSDIFATLATGATLVLRPAHLRIPDKAFGQFLRDQAITVSDLPTAFWHLWVQEMAAGRCGFSPSLRLVIVGGEKAELRHFNTWQSLPETQACRWINSYGPTEATVIATVWKPENRVLCLNQNVPIGYPLTNTRLYILDTQGQPVPIGVAGEIHIGGMSVARGYLNRPDLTAERFITDPFSPQPNARMYKTGDLGRWLPDGTIEYLERNDFQVKIRGFRIELGEIEAQLAQCEGVKDAVVVAREEENGNKRLVAYVIPQPGITLDIIQLREQLSSRLMEYMLPGAYVILDAFPVNPNGKLDRKALPAPDSSALISREYQAPQGEAEQQLAAIWQTLLGLEQVGRHDNFFELGGHSLLVVNLIEELRQRDLTLEVSTVFSSPTLMAMASRITDTTISDNVTFMVPPNLITDDSHAITPDMLPLITLTQNNIDQIVANVPNGVANIQDIYPLGPLQEGILFHHLLETKGDIYLDNLLMTFDSRTRLDTFLLALQQVINRHDILRSAFQWDNLPEPVQVVYRHAPLPVTELELSAGTDAAQQLRDATDPRQIRMDITKAPLLSACIAKDPHTEHWHLALLYHHLVCDHLSLEMIFNEVQILQLGQNESLPPSLPYRNFIAQIRAVPVEKHQDYFHQLLGDVDEPTLPFNLLDVQGNHDEHHKIEEAGLELDDELSRQIRDCARQQGVSAAVLFHVAWAQVLAQCSGREDVVFGTVLLGRSLKGADTSQVLGMFINTLPVRIMLQERTAQQVIQETYQQLSTLLEHEQTPLAIAQRCSGIQAPQPLFSSLLNFRHSQHNDQQADSAIWQGIQTSSSEERSNYPLSLDVDDFGDGFALTAQCNRQINPARINAYMDTALKALVMALQEMPEQDIHSLNILPPAELTQLLEGFNSNKVDCPQDMLLQQLFEQQAALTPDAIALIHAANNGEAKLTYSELNQKANQLAHALIAAGVKPDDRVAICVERGLDMVIGLFGILKSGAGYVPLDTDYPTERLNYILSDCAPKLLLTQQHLHSRLSTDTPVWMLDDHNHTECIARQPIYNPDPQQLGLAPHHLAYIIYTSGSTGQPKGVMIEHHNVVNFVHVQRQTNELTSSDRVLQFTSVAFDTTVSDIFATLAAGATLIMRPSELRVPDRAFAQFLQQQQITVTDLPTAFWHLWVQEMAAGRCGFSPSLRLVIVGGEKAELRHLMTWQALPETRSCRWINSYGPTETTVIATVLKVDSHPAYSAETLPIGYPLANSRIYILDTRGKPVPVGVSGEIHIAGAGVARGYLNQPELTDERFIPDTFSEQPNARMYKTGDLGRWLPDGTIEYLGRNDFQVKIRGFRIELGEIETQLAACEGVKDAIAMVREDETGDKRLVAYLVPQPDAQLDIADLREQLSTHLLDYMIPSAFVVIEAFPLNPNGKLDRKSLPVPDRSATATKAYEAPEGETEQQLAAIWQTLLGLEQVGRHDDFFELGGNSLSIMQLSARLQEEFHLEISITDIFRHSALAKLAELILSKQVETFFDQDIEDMQKELENLSEDELLAMLNGEQLEGNKL